MKALGKEYTRGFHSKPTRGSCLKVLFPYPHDSNQIHLPTKKLLEYFASRSDTE